MKVHKLSEKINNLPPQRRERVLQMISDITCDIRLEDALGLLHEVNVNLNKVRELSNIKKYKKLDNKITELQKDIEKLTKQDYSVNRHKLLIKIIIERVARCFGRQVSVQE